MDKCYLKIKVIKVDAKLVQNKRVYAKKFSIYTIQILYNKVCFMIQIVNLYKVLIN